MARVPLPVVSFWLCVSFLFTTAHAGFVVTGRGYRNLDLAKMLANVDQVRLPTGRSVNTYACARGDALVQVGSEWTERCRQCKCTEAGAQCTSDITCPKPYDSMQEITCAKWADNRCCCAVEGCLLQDGTAIEVGGAIPFDPARPCYNCTCIGANRTSCLMRDLMSCSLKCVDGVRVKGQCCPHCPNGPTCFLPFNEMRGLSTAELRSLMPVQQSRPVTLHRGTPSEVSCTCHAKSMMAKCSSVSSRAGGRFREIPPVV